jgi:hypothetical protein
VRVSGHDLAAVHVRSRQLGRHRRENYRKSGKLQYNHFFSVERECVCVRADALRSTASSRAVSAVRSASRTAPTAIFRSPSTQCGEHSFSTRTTSLLLHYHIRTAFSLHLTLHRAASHRHSFLGVTKQGIAGIVTTKVAIDEYPSTVLNLPLTAWLADPAAGKRILPHHSAWCEQRSELLGRVCPEGRRGSSQGQPAGEDNGTLAENNYNMEKRRMDSIFTITDRLQPRKQY